MNKLKLATLSEKILKEKESKALLGGNCCRSSCYWEGQKGGATWDDNLQANYERNTESVHGCNQYAWCEEWPLDVDPDWLHE